MLYHVLVLHPSLLLLVLHYGSEERAAGMIRALMIT
jgi:hypothetical protein